MHDMIKCLSSELRQSEVFQFIDEIEHDYHSLIELIPWNQEKLDMTTEDNIAIAYQFKNDEIQAIFLYKKEEWQVTCVISILDNGNKLVIEETRIRLEREQMRIVNKVTSIYYEESKHHQNGSSSYYTITEDNAMEEPVEESHIMFDYNGEVRSSMNISEIESAIEGKYSKKKKRKW